MDINIKKLREDLKNDALGAFFGGGFGGALFEVCDLDRVSDEELIEIAIEKGIDISRYVY